VNGKPWRVNSDLNELAGAHMLLDDIGRNLKAIAVLFVHRDPIDQQVAIGKVLPPKSLF
jgi:hypothetical protein